MRFHLWPMEKEETRDYVRKHLEAVKASGEIFTQAAIDLIHEYCGGVPRKIYKVCTACLMTATNKNSTLVDDYLVRMVIECEFEG